MKRLIYSASSKFKGTDAAEMVKEFLESLGFQNISVSVQRGKPGTSGGNAKIKFLYELYEDNNSAVDYANFDNFKLAQELYGYDEEGFNDPYTHRGSGYSNIYNGIVSDVRAMFDKEGLDVILDKHASGLSGIWSTLEIMTYVPRS